MVGLAQRSLLVDPERLRGAHVSKAGSFQSAVSVHRRSREDNARGQRATIVCREWQQSGSGDLRTRRHETDSLPDVRGRFCVGTGVRRLSFTYAINDLQEFVKPATHLTCALRQPGTGRWFSSVAGPEP